jgi:uncharacterized protein YwqG
MDRETITQKLNEAGLEQYVEALEPLMRSAIRALPEAVEDDDEIPLGASKLGGRPDLPVGTPWPVVDEVLLEFVGQFRMEEVAPLDETGLLPKEGILYFFFDGMLTDYDQGRSPDRCKVLHVGEDRVLQRLEVPEHDHGIFFSRYNPCRVTWTTTVNLPPYEEITDLDGMLNTILADTVEFEETSHCWTYADVRRGMWDPGTQFLGNVVNLQGGEEKFAAVRKRFPGRYVYEDYTYTHAEEMSRKIGDLVLLFTVDSEPAAGMSWGDNGLVMYWIDRADLEAGRWEAVWASMTSA